MTVLLFFPCLTCLFWLALNPLVHRKKDAAFKHLGLLLAVTGIALFAEAGLACTDGKTMLSFFLAKQFFALLVIPVALAYIHSLSTEDNTKPSSVLAWLAAPVSLLFAEFILIALAGADGFMENIGNPASYQSDKTGNLIRLCSFWIFYGLLLTEALMSVSVIAAKLVKGNRHIQLYNTLAAIITYTVLEVTVIFAGTRFQWITATVSIPLTCILFILSYSGLFHGIIGVRFKDLINGVVESVPEESDWNRQDVAGTDSQAGVEPIQSPVKRYQPGALVSEANRSLEDEERLRIRFEDLILTEQLFLKQGIRLSDIASMLETNRTYVSRFVNNMSFSDYMNTLRIDYAEQYLLHHRDAKQSEIALACGFTNASAFNNVFKKITGVTPKIWLATRS